jgi:hypothetical protein
LSVELKTTQWKRGRVSAATAVESALATTVATKPSQFIPLESWRGGCIRVYSNGADNETATITLYSVSEDTDNGWQMQSLGTIAITLGTSTAILNTIAADPNMTGTKRWADTMTWTATTYGTAMLTRVGGNIAAFSPADNTIAELLVSDFGSPMGIAMMVTTYSLTATSALMPVLRLEV